MTELTIGEDVGFCEHGKETSNCKSDFFSSREIISIRKNLLRNEKYLVI
jgi:hypothetical protein